MNEAVQSDVVIERARLEDVDAIRQVLRETWVDTYTPGIPVPVVDTVTGSWHSAERITAEINDGAIVFKVARDDAGSVVGLITCRIDESRVLLSRLYVLPAWQRQGLGARLYDAAIARIPPHTPVFLEVEAQNDRAIEFYRRRGFRVLSAWTDEVAGVAIPVVTMVRTGA